MCGILGTVNIPFTDDKLDLIRHRGPDFGNITKTSVGEATVYLGHRRLAIVDLSELGNQPMKDPATGNEIIFNGEIYNHLDLKRNIEGRNFKGHSDTETILYYISKFGMNAIEKFNGIFALAYLDRVQEKLFLARDLFGVKPLYYYHDADEFIFSSELRPIEKMAQLKTNKTQLAQLLKLRYSAAPDTVYSTVSKLKPGHTLEYDLKNHKTTLSTFQKSVNINPNADFNKSLDRYGNLLEKAVERQLMADVEIGLLLSGGIDSALIGHFMAQKSALKPKSFTVGFGQSFKESELNEARETAALLGTDHHEVMVDQTNFLDYFEKTTNIVEEPLGTTSTIPMYFLNKEVSNHVKVVLTGQGADEPLAGYPKYKGLLMGSKIPNFVFNSLKPISPLIKNEKAYRAIKAFGEKDVIKRLEKTCMLFDDREIESLIGLSDKKSYRKIDYFYRLLHCENKSPIEAMMVLDARMNLSDDLLLYTDKISMHFGLETRVPFLDSELVAFLESLPVEFKLKNGKGKYIHRKFAEAILPNKIINREKKGFLSPTREWFKESLGDFLWTEVNKKDTAFSEFFKIEPIGELLKAHRKGVNKEKQLFLILSLLFWFKNNCKNR